MYPTDLNTSTNNFFNSSKIQKALGAGEGAKNGLVLFCLAAKSAHSASKGSLGVIWKLSDPLSKDTALECDLNEGVLLGEVPSILLGSGDAELTISSHCSGLGNGAVAVDIILLFAEQTLELKFKLTDGAVVA